MPDPALTLALVVAECQAAVSAGGKENVMLDERKLQVLRAIVSDYVSSREPVGSKALVERHQLGVSPATVRNDMATLEEEGYIHQPHTSAGRIPTDKGYRLFVDQLAGVKPLSAAERKAISSFLAGAADIDDIVLRTVRLLAQLTHQVAIVQYPVIHSATVRRIELVPLTPERALVIVVNSAGRVEQRTLETPPSSDEDLMVVRDLLNRATVDAPAQTAIANLRALLGDDAAVRPALWPAAAASVLELLALDPSSRIVVGGVNNVARFADDFATSVRPVLEALEEQVVLLKLLTELEDSTDVTVRIGQENTVASLQTTSLVAAGYGEPADAWASLGIVGPTRMDYPSTMAAVRAVARYVGRYLAEG